LPPMKSLSYSVLKSVICATPPDRSGSASSPAA
jgi:hypothetical protein